MELKLELSNLGSAAENFLSFLGNKRKVAFYGNMGAGKTTFITSLCDQLKALDLVSSPTFSIVNEYETESGELIYHFDFYRIKETEELYDIGFEEYIDSDNWCFIEWPEKAASLISEDFLKVKIEPSIEGERLLKVID